ncbi:GGDEF domain-containing protein [Nocardioides sp. AN3]
MYLGAAVLAAVVAPLRFAELGHARTPGGGLLPAVVVMAASVLNVEIGRALEGGVSNSQRPHKALSAWTFATCLLLSLPWLLPVVAFTYAHAWWRGLRVPVWKWVGSAAFLVLCGTAAAVAASVVAGRDMDLMQGSGLRGLLAVLVGAATFLAVETLLFHGSAYINDPADEVWLRNTLRSRSFYLTEGGVLLVGGLSAAIWTGAPWFLLLLVPVYALTQRAALHAPLRERADGDEKTGLLRFDAWRRLAELGVQRCQRRHEPWNVMFIDVDHFKRFNDTWGHLAGDRALVAVARTIAQVLAASVGQRAVLGRFGGEEFCVFIESPDHEASAAAEQIRVAVSHLDSSELGIPHGEQVTISIGMATVRPGAPARLPSVLEEADHALFHAKEAGRNTTVTQVVAATPHP